MSRTLKRVPLSFDWPIAAIVPCAVHPLHAVKVRASGARSGCPMCQMCEMQIEDVCHALSAKPPEKPPNPHEHRPRVVLDRRAGLPTRVLGCTCGWKTPAGTTYSDDAYSWHLALKRTVAR